MIDGHGDSEQYGRQFDLRRARKDFFRSSAGRFGVRTSGNREQKTGTPPRNGPGESDAITVSDAGQIVICWNKAAEKMFGWLAEEVLGKPIAGLLQTEYPGCKRQQAFEQMAQGGCFEGEAVLRHKNGSMVFANIYSVALRSEGGGFNGFLAIFRENAGPGRRLGVMRADGPERDEAVAMSDANQIVTHWNRTAERLFGWRAEEVVGKPLAGLLQAEYPGCGRERAFADVKDTGFFKSEVVLRHKNGFPVCVEIYSGVRCGEGDRIEGFFAIFRESKGERKTEHVLTDREREYLEVTDSPTGGTFVHDLQKKAAFYSTAWKIRLGAEDFSPEELCGLPERLVHPDDYPRLMESCRKAFAIRAARICMEIRIKMADSGYRWIHGEAKIRYGEGGMPLKLIGTQVDVTEQRIATQSLHFLADVLAGVHDAVIAIGQDEKVCYWNRVTEQLSGIPAQDIIGVSLAHLLSMAFVAYEDAVRIQRNLDTCGVYTGEVAARGKHGALVWGDMHIKQTHGAGGFSGIVITFRDITERKLAEEQLSFQANLLASANEGILFVDKNQVISYWNRAAEKQYGWAVQEALGKKVTHLLELEAPEGSLDELYALLLRDGVLTCEVLARRKDGTQIWIESYSRTLQDGRGNYIGYVNSTRDITMRRYAMAQSERRHQIVQAINRVYAEYVACETLEQLGNVCLQIAEEATGSRMSFVGEMGNGGMFYDVAMSQNAQGKCVMADGEGHKAVPGVFPVRGLYGEALRSGKTLLANNPEEHPASLGLPQGHPPLENYLAVPYVQGGCVRGLLSVGNRPGGYGEAERETLEALTPTVMSVLMRKQAETALKESESLYRTLFENANDAFMVLEPVLNPDRGRITDARFVQLSQNFARHTGAKAADVEGKTLLALYPETEPYWLDAFDHVARRRSAIHYQNYHAGTKRWYDMFCFPYGKELAGILFRNITKQKQTEEALLRAREELAQRAVDKYQSLFRSIDEGFCILQVEQKDGMADYRILEANERYYLQTGKPPETAGKSMRSAVPGIDEYWYKLFWQVAASGNPERRANMYCTPAKRWLDAYVFPAGKPGSGLVAALFRDVTERKRSEDMLRENERLYRTIFENSQDGFILAEVLFDEAGKPNDNRLLKINRAFELISGLKAEQTVGRTAEEIGIVIGQRTLDMQEFCLRAGKTAHFEEYNKEIDRWFDVYMFQYGGDSVGELFRDITRRKQYQEVLHQSEILYRTLFDNTKEGFMLCQPVADERGRYTDMAILSINRGWERQTGLRAEDGVLEKPASFFFGKEEKGWLKILGPVAKNGRSVNFEEYNHYTGRWYDVHAFLYKKDMVGVTLRNITDRKRAEEALRESQQKALRLVEELEASNRNKNEFINTLSHELRNPLAAISAGIQLMELTKDKEHTKRAKDVIRRQMNQLCRLTDDLLDLTRITNNKIRLKKEQVELNSLAGQVAEDHRPLFREKGVELVTNTAAAPILLEADPARLRQAIGNLLHNALKFTENGGNTVLEVLKEDGEAVVTVLDTGLGIAEDLIDSLFEPFCQAENSMERPDCGLGLGLSITRGIAELHGGSVSAYSAGLNQGSRFSIRLPAREVVPAEEERQEGQSAFAAPLCILLIEDNRDQAEILCMALGRMGHKAEFATDGASGIKAALDTKPDIVLCDIGLPGMDGYEVAAAIRSEPSLSHTLLVALTGFASDRYKKRSIQAGFQTYLCKPVDMALLEKLLASARGGGPENAFSGPDTCGG